MLVHILLLQSICFVTYATSRQSDIIYEEKVITQKKGQLFSDFLKDLDINEIEKKLLNNLPILHKVNSERKFHMFYNLEKQKKQLKEIKIRRGEKFADYIIIKENGIYNYREKQEKPIIKKIEQNSNLLEIGRDWGILITNFFKRYKEALKEIISVIPKTNYVAINVEQKIGDDITDLWKKAELTEAEQKTLKTGKFSKKAKENRKFTLFFEKDGEDKYLKGLRITKNKKVKDYIIRNINNKDNLIDLKSLNHDEISYISDLYSKANFEKPIEYEIPGNDSIDVGDGPKKVKPITLETTQRNIGKFKLISITQRKGQNLSSIIKEIGFNSSQRNLIMLMPANLSAKTSRRIHFLFKKNKAGKFLLKAIRIVRGDKVAEYLLVKYKGFWEWADENGKVKVNDKFARYPLNFSYVSSNFNLHRRHPITKKIRPHKGIDLKASYGTPIYAPSNGIVTFSGRQRGYGIILEIDHRNGYRTKYAHLSRIMSNARKGHRVRKGELIARVGNTGASTGSHLHYEILVNGIAKNPATVRLPRSNKKVIKAGIDAVNKYLSTLHRLSN